MRSSIDLCHQKPPRYCPVKLAQRPPTRRIGEKSAELIDKTLEELGQQTFEKVMEWKVPVIIAMNSRTVCCVLLAHLAGSGTETDRELWNKTNRSKSRISRFGG
jgi:hypothetical protein